MENGDQSGIIVKTFGCRLNSYESEVMRREAHIAGLHTLPGGAILINTCAVTGEAVRQAKQAIRAARRQNPLARIIVSGCAAQTEPEIFADMAEVDLIIGNEDKLHAHSYRALPDFGVNDCEKIRVNDIMSVRETASHMIDGIADRARAFVQVQNGCDHRCTFCIIPFGRGNSRSVPMGSVVDQVRRLVDNGHREIVITGVDITSYGGDLPQQPSLGKLVQLLLQHIPDLPRLRLSTIDSIEVDEPLLEVIASEPRFMPHLHLSIQSGDDMILKRMKRRHLSEHTKNFCQKVRQLRPDVVFGADLIAGFPTETDAMFANTLDMIEQCGITYVHAFPFSARKNTPAARMPMVDRGIVKQRAAMLRQAGEQALQKHLQRQLGRPQNVLIEQRGCGRSEQYTKFTGLDGEAGDIVTVIARQHDGKSVIAADQIRQPGGQFAVAENPGPDL